MSELFELKLKIGASEIEIKGEYLEVKDMLSMLVESKLIQKSTVLISDNISKNSESKSTIESDPINDDGKPLSEEKKPRKKRSTTSKATGLEIVELNPKFDEVRYVNQFKKYHITTMKARIFVLLFMYQEMTGINEFNESLIHTLLDKVAIDTPKSLVTMLNNYMNRDKLIEKTSEGYKLKYVGNNYAKGLMVPSAD